MQAPVTYPILALSPRATPHYPQCTHTRASAAPAKPYQGSIPACPLSTLN